jgi:hypothetical protein
MVVVALMITNDPQRTGPRRIAPLTKLLAVVAGTLVAGAGVVAYRAWSASSRKPPDVAGPIVPDDVRPARPSALPSHPDPDPEPHPSAGDPAAVAAAAAALPPTPSATPPAATTETLSLAQPEEATRYLDARTAGVRRMLDLLDRAIAEARQDPQATPEHIAALERHRAERKKALEALRESGAPPLATGE